MEQLDAPPVRLPAVAPESGAGAPPPTL